MRRFEIIAAILPGAVAFAMSMVGQAGAHEVLRSQLVGDSFVQCGDWLAARKASTPKQAELESFVRGYTEGVAAHLSSGPTRQGTLPSQSSQQGPFTFDKLYDRIDAYCTSYDDTLQAAVEIVLERQWPKAGASLLSDMPASKDEYIFVPNKH